MRKLILLTSLTMLFVTMTTPALAQESESPTDIVEEQYTPSPVGPGTTIQSIAEDAVEGIVSQGQDADGAAAYEAALNAARDAGADEETAEVVAARAVAEVSESEASETEITELPDTGGASTLVLGSVLLLIGAGVLVRRLF